MRTFSRRLLIALSAIGLVAALAPAVHASTSSAASTPPVPGAQRFEGGWAVPVSTKAPAWFDKSFYDRVVAAGDNGVRVPAGVSMPAAAGTDLRPALHPRHWLITLPVPGSRVAGRTA